MAADARIVLLTADGLRHRYVARKLSERLNLVGIVIEAKVPVVANPEQLPAEDQQVIRRHFEERDQVESELLGRHAVMPDVERIEGPRGVSNTAEAFEWVEARKPDLLVLYGTGIVKAPLLEACDERIINIHLGLSPHYKGAGTNFWPLVHRKPECVGATIHLAVNRVDAGPILAQVRPAAEVSDRAHQLGNKTLIAAVDALPHVIDLFQGGALRPIEQQLSDGEEYRRKHFNADAVRQMLHHFETGMMTEYLADQQARCDRYPIHELSGVAVSTAQ